MKTKVDIQEDFMKKIKILVALCLTVFLMLVSLSACKVSHTHDFSGDWQTDANDHWKECTDEGCDQRTGFAAHVFDDGSADVDSGKKVYTCKVCEFTREEDHTARTEVSADEWAAATAPASPIPAWNRA